MSLLRVRWHSGSKVSLTGIVAVRSVRLQAEWQQNARSLTGSVAVSSMRFAGLVAAKRQIAQKLNGNEQLAFGRLSGSKPPDRSQA